MEAAHHVRGGAAVESSIPNWRYAGTQPPPTHTVETMAQSQLPGVQQMQPQYPANVQFVPQYGQGSGTPIANPEFSRGNRMTDGGVPSGPPSALPRIHYSTAQQQHPEAARKYSRPPPEPRYPPPAGPYNVSHEAGMPGAPPHPVPPHQHNPAVHTASSLSVPASAGNVQRTFPPHSAPAGGPRSHDSRVSPWSRASPGAYPPAAPSAPAPDQRGPRLTYEELRANFDSNPFLPPYPGNRGPPAEPAPQLAPNQWVDAPPGPCVRKRSVSSVFAQAGTDSVKRMRMSPALTAEEKKEITALMGEKRCFGTCPNELLPHVHLFGNLTKDKDEAGDRKVSLKKQNDYLLNILYDDHGECRYHADCVVRIFKISKGRLKRLNERKRRALRGEDPQHALFGRPSNNRKKPETLEQFIEFVKQNRVVERTEDNKLVYRLSPWLRRIQGDSPSALRVRFNLHQQTLSTSENPRELISSGTAQTWFKTHFPDTLPPLVANSLPYDASVTASSDFGRQTKVFSGRDSSPLDESDTSRSEPTKPTVERKKRQTKPKQRATTGTSTDSSEQGAQKSGPGSSSKPTSSPGDSDSQERGDFSSDYTRETGVSRTTDATAVVSSVDQLSRRDLANLATVCLASSHMLSGPPGENASDDSGEVVGGFSVHSPILD